MLQTASQLHTFWSKPFSIFGSLKYNDDLQHSPGLTIPLFPSASPLDASSLSNTSRHYLRIIRGYIVPDASHPLVTENAGSGRKLLVEQQVLSHFHMRKTIHPSNFVSHVISNLRQFTLNSHFCSIKLSGRRYI